MVARKPRIYVEGCAQHLIQRGNNRSVCFFQEADYAFYIKTLKDCSKKYGVAIHSFVLMTNHVHLLVTPAGKQSISKMMQALGRNYVRYINLTYRRTGTLWEGRFKSSLVASDRYFLVVSRYIELNPVRAKMVKSPGEYPWSSFRHNAMGIKTNLVTEHLCYQSLGTTPAARLVNYKSLFRDEIPLDLLEDIRLCSQKEWVIGSDKFRRQIEDACGRAVHNMTWGGDRKSSDYRAKKPRSLTP